VLKAAEPELPVLQAAEPELPVLQALEPELAALQALEPELLLLRRLRQSSRRLMVRHELMLHGLMRRVMFSKELR
jgi:adenylate kinase